MCEVECSIRSSSSLRGSNKSKEKERSKLEKLKAALFPMLSHVGCSSVQLFLKISKDGDCIDSEWPVPELLCSPDSWAPSIRDRLFCRRRGHVLHCQWNALLCWDWEEPSSWGMCHVAEGSCGAPHRFVEVKHWFVPHLPKQLSLATQVSQGTIYVLKKVFRVNRWAQKKIGPN